MRILVDRFANVDPANGTGATPLYIAAQKGHLEVSSLLINRSANVDAADKDGFTPLLKAAYNGNRAIVRLLVDRSANVDTRNKWGDTALQVANKMYLQWDEYHEAEKNDHWEIAQLLRNHAATTRP